MLVLSRKENEKILFPGLGMALQILRVNGGKVRLGIEAPGDVSVVRYEIASEDQLAEVGEMLKRSAHGTSHDTRNKIHTLFLGLSLMQKQLARNMNDDAEETLQRLIETLEGMAGAPEKPVGDAARRPRRKALLVEDNSNERRLLESYLSLSGFDVEAVDDGLKALDYLASHEPPDAVVMDMQLPRLGGAAAVGVLRSDPRFQGLKVYAVSGMDRGELHLPVGPQGVDHWFSKPLDPRELVELMNLEMNCEMEAVA